MWGFLADTKGRRKVIQPTLLVGFLISFASSFALNFYEFAIMRFLTGFFISGSSATIYAYLGERAKQYDLYEHCDRYFISIPFQVNSTAINTEIERS